MEEARAAALAGELVDAVNARDVDRALTLMHPDVVLTPLVVQSGVVPEPYRGHDGARSYFESFSRFWGDGRMRLLGVHAVADVIVAFARAGVQGQDDGLPVTYVCRVADDRVIELAAFADLERVREVLAGQAAKGSPRPLDVTLPAVPSSVPVARHALRAFLEAAGVDEATGMQVALAATEAVSNVVVHAYRDTEAQGEVAVGACVAGSQLTVTVADDGCGLKPRPDSPGLGLGISLMSHQAAELTFVVPPQREAGTEVRMCFELAA